MYIEVILPVPLADSYTYFVPPEMEKRMAPGIRVQVEFGKNKRYSGIVHSIRQIPLELLKTIKPILAVESERPIVCHPQLPFWEWIADYYLCKLGEVCHAALPPGLRSESPTAYTAKKKTFVRLTARYSENTDFNQTFESVKRAAKQEELLLAFFHHTQETHGVIAKNDLLTNNGASTAALNGLIKKGILETFEKTISRLPVYSPEVQEPNTLHPRQQQAYRSITKSFKEKEVCLLHGVTSSGKTEIYIHLMAKTLEQNRQALLLLPEIALTTQITERIRKFFGNKVGVYHSRINDNERVEIWNHLLDDSGYQIIIGARSSLFLPFKDLGLIIVDEEHEPSYKQQDPAPRYHARNAAIVLAKMHGAKTLLGSATPSIESYFNAQTGKYGYVRLDKRFEEKELPTIIPVDVKELRRKKKMKSIFSPLLIEKIQETLQAGEQVLLFQNRRGFSPALSCRICDWMPKCRFCDVSLTYHKQSNRLSCHYCGRTYPVLSACPECGNPDLKPIGFGTEKVEEEVKTVFPGISVARIDTDTTKNKKSFEIILSDFASGKTQILIGTQMISKGLDFENVRLVGILNADSLMNFPDFRAYERAWQLISQVAGRAGRRKTSGEVILQTSHPDHPLIRTALSHQYEAMYEMQMEERQLFRYPPFYRLIYIYLKHKKEDVLNAAAHVFAQSLREKLGDRVLGPEKPPTSRIQNLYIRRILLKIEAGVSVRLLHEIIKESQNRIRSESVSSSVIIQYDVDPV
ncbi:MAG: primosomal protein N' [Candidatus Azobacteroides sp.]|nr:primosomal protein N' [Candidatus Azobacteroides sp.]